ncbi:hypothetical protein HKI87_07g49000 [Chloropicon roscoffensis]|uniref:Uncharacterized protein n=1 Tax=Chloropicon roscoffensis TaxID=1461544 RepID=A0AAX4PAF0_9CHLO
MFLTAEKFTSDLSDWDTCKVTDMTRMFDAAHALKEKPSWVPYMTTIGNHERDWPNSGGRYGGQDSGGECGVPYMSRL